MTTAVKKTILPLPDLTWEVEEVIQTEKELEQYLRK